MGILGQILKLTAISIFFSAAATVYVVDTDFYKSFIKKENSPTLNSPQNIDRLTKDQIKKYREHLRNTRIEKRTTESKALKESENKNVWQNKYKE